MQQIHVVTLMQSWQVCTAVCNLLCEVIRVRHKIKSLRQRSVYVTPWLLEQAPPTMNAIEFAWWSLWRWLRMRKRDPVDMEIIGLKVTFRWRNEKRSSARRFSIDFKGTKWAFFGGKRIHSTWFWKGSSKLN